MFNRPKFDHSQSPYVIGSFKYFPYADTHGKHLLPVNISSDAEELIDYFASKGKDVRLPKIIVFNEDHLERGFTIELISSLQKEKFDALSTISLKKTNTDLLTEFPEHFYKKNNEINSPYFKKIGNKWLGINCVEAKPMGRSGSGQVHRDFEKLFIKYHPRQCELQFLHTLPSKKPTDSKPNKIYAKLNRVKNQCDYAIWNEEKQHYIKGTISLSTILEDLKQDLHDMSHDEIENTLQVRVRDLLTHIYMETPEAKDVVLHDELLCIGGGQNFKFIETENGHQLKLSYLTDMYTSAYFNAQWLEFPPKFDCKHSEFLLIHRYYDDFAIQRDYLENENNSSLSIILPRTNEEEHTWWLTRRLPYFIAHLFQDAFFTFLKNKNIIQEQDLLFYQANLQQELETIQALAKKEMTHLASDSEVELKERYSLDFALYQWEYFFANHPENRITFLLQVLYISCGKPLDHFHHVNDHASQLRHPLRDILVYVRHNISLLNPTWSKAEIDTELSRLLNIPFSQKTQRSALTHAAEYGDEEIVSQLIQAGSSVNHADEKGETPLMKTTKLLTHIALILLPTDNTDNPQKIYKDAIRIQQNTDGDYEVFWDSKNGAAKRKIQKNIFQKDCSRLASLMSEDSGVCTISNVEDIRQIGDLCAIDINSCVLKMENLIRAKADVHAKDHLGNSVLHHCIAPRAEKMLRLLIKENIDPTLQNSTNKTALDLAIELLISNPDAISNTILLFDYEADYRRSVNQRNLSYNKIRMLAKIAQQYSSHMQELEPLIAHISSTVNLRYNSSDSRRAQLYLDLMTHLVKNSINDEQTLEIIRNIILNAGFDASVVKKHLQANPQLIDKSQLINRIANDRKTKIKITFFKHENQNTNMSNHSDMPHAKRRT